MRNIGGTGRRVKRGARVLVEGFEPTRAFAQRRERSLRLPVSPHQPPWLRTLAIPKDKTRNPARAAARADTMRRECGLMVSIKRLEDQLHAREVQAGCLASYLFFKRSQHCHPERRRLSLRMTGSLATRKK